MLVNIFEGGKTPPLPARQLEEMGFRLGIYPSQTHRAAIFAAQEVLAILRRDGDAALFEKCMVSFGDREMAVNTARWSELERKYMSLV